MLSQSDIIVRPGSLTERLAAAAPPQAEPTPTTMAERFAPEAQKNGGGDGPGRPPAEPTVSARDRPRAEPRAARQIAAYCSPRCSSRWCRPRSSSS